jgi:hypothetical protein
MKCSKFLKSGTPVKILRLGEPKGAHVDTQSKCVLLGGMENWWRQCSPYEYLMTRRVVMRAIASMS